MSECNLDTRLHTTAHNYFSLVGAVKHKLRISNSRNKITHLEVGIKIIWMLIKHPDFPPRFFFLQHSFNTKSEMEKDDIWAYRRPCWEAWVILYIHNFVPTKFNRRGLDWCTTFLQWSQQRYDIRGCRNSRASARQNIVEELCVYACTCRLQSNWLSTWSLEKFDRIYWLILYSRYWSGSHWDWQTFSTVPVICRNGSGQVVCKSTFLIESSQKTKTTKIQSVRGFKCEGKHSKLKLHIIQVLTWTLILCTKLIPSDSNCCLLACNWAFFNSLPGSSLRC